MLLSWPVAKPAAVDQRSRPTAIEVQSRQPQGRTRVAPGGDVGIELIGR